MQVPKRRSEQSVKRDTGPALVTAGTLARWKKQVEQLETGVPEMIKEVERTKEHGDFSENAAYQDAKHTLRRTYGRIESLKDKIKRAVLIEKSANNEIVQLGSTVVLEAAGKKHTFEVLGHHEADPSRGRISDQSPLGSALLGAKVGDVVVVDLTSGPMKYLILEIR